MADSQSRYGIMQELSEKKIAKREELANIERQADQQTFAMQQQIDRMEKDLKDKEQNYEFNHQTWKKETEMKLKLMKSEHKREEEALEKEIAAKDENYKDEFADYKQHQTAQIEGTKENLKRFNEAHKKSVDFLNEVIKEIDESISDLKEVSKEQSKV